METSQKSVRVMHYIGEFLDLDAKSSTSIAEFIALIQAIREGLGRIDSGFVVADYHINLLFLSKLEAHPEWNQWARSMLRDKRVNLSDYLDDRMSFRELAELAIQREREMRAATQMAKRKQQEQHEKKQDKSDAKQHQTSRKEQNRDLNTKYDNRRLHSFTQEEINSFVIRQMHKTHQPTTVSPSKGHTKRPSQEEINEFVIRQMQKEQERKARARSKSEPELKRASTTMTVADTAAKCDMCGSRAHPGQNCLSHITKPVAVVPQAKFLPKKVEYRTKTPGAFPMYHTSFALT